ncbi:hypothetical protein HYW72_02470 [Candidatus Nomurabacteria bacterium]|nr:hypothetical protein [Candidatus Nomurabacteria bacterium]
MDWKPIMVFYAKTTSWIIFPLVIGLVAGQFTESQILFFIFLMVGLGVSCFGIYREIKEYKKNLDPPSHKATADEEKYGNE